MKRFFTIAVVLFSVCANIHAPQEADVVAGLDPTAYTSITGSVLLQLVQNATIGQTNKGCIIRQATAPDVANNPRYTNFLWLDLSAGTPGTLRQYVSGSWVSATLGVGSVTSANIAAGGVTTTALADGSVTTPKLAAAAVDSTKIGAGQILNPAIAAGAISNANIADLTITGAKLAYQTIANTNVIDGTLSGSKLQAGTITGALIGNGQVALANLATNAVGQSNIAPGAVYYGAITNNAVETNSINFGPARTLLTSGTNGAAVQWRTMLQLATVLDMGAGSASAQHYSVAHGLGVRPGLVRMVMTNNSTDAGYAVGDEVEVNNVSYVDGGGTAVAITTASDATSIYLSFGPNSSINVGNRGTGVATATTATKWGFRALVYK